MSYEDDPFDVEFDGDEDPFGAVEYYDSPGGGGGARRPPPPGRAPTSRGPRYSVVDDDQFERESVRDQKKARRAQERAQRLAELKEQKLRYMLGPLLFM